jgi:hypothetical protein
MTASSIYLLYDLGLQARRMSTYCGNERKAMLRQYVARDPTLVTAELPTSQVLRGALASPGSGRGHGQSS